MSQAVRISVVLVTRDRPRLLRDAIASVDAQSRRPLEVRIADDGERSALATVESFPGLETTVIPTHAGRAGAARNAAADGARGDVLAFLDDDDLWKPGHLEGLSAAFEDPRVRFAWRDFDVVRERLEPSGERRVLEARAIAEEWDADAIARDYYVATSAWAMRRELFESLGGFDESYRYTEDWELLLRVAAQTRPVRVPGRTVEVRLREGGHLSFADDRERLECLERLAHRHGLATPERKTFWDVAVERGTPVG